MESLQLFGLIFNIFYCLDVFDILQVQDLGRVEFQVVRGDLCVVHLDLTFEASENDLLFYGIRVLFIFLSVEFLESGGSHTIADGGTLDLRLIYCVIGVNHLIQFTNNGLSLLVRSRTNVFIPLRRIDCLVVYERLELVLASTSLRHSGLNRRRGLLLVLINDEEEVRASSFI